LGSTLSTFGTRLQIPNASLIGVKLFLGRVKYVLFDSLLRVPWISFFITSVRFFFIKYVLRRKLQMWSVDNEKTVNYDYSKSHYSKILIRPLTRSVIPISLASSLLWPEPFDKKILIIGPRYESDYFLARGYGFAKSNISLVDHFSYSRLITVGDAHQLNFENNSFDVVIASWILVYSKNQQQLLSELRRVIKPKTGLAIITGDHSLSPHNPIPNYGTNSGYVFDSANIKKYWPMRDDDFLIQWPSHTPVIGGTAQVIVAIQKSSDQ